MVAVGLSFVAGLLTALSPCVLPALPIIVGSAAADRRHGPLALAAGLVIAFTAVGVGLSSLGSIAGVDNDAVRTGAGVMLLAAGLLLLVPRWQNRLSGWLAPVASGANRLASRAGGGLAGQFAVGALLGAVWSPCVGPTLGAAVGLAASGDSLGRATTMMLAFGVGSAMPLVAAAYASRGLMARRVAIGGAAARGKVVFGVALVALGALVISGADRLREAAVLARLPQWWIDLLASV
jgi:cytochrome c biogenesis protein CcdA